MKANVAININPFQVPYSVTAMAFTNSLPPVPAMPAPWGTPPGPPSAPPGPFTVPLSELDPATLEQLCDDFRTRVFELAGKQPPERAFRYVPMSELSVIESHLSAATDYPNEVGDALDRIRAYLEGF